MCVCRGVLLYTVQTCGNKKYKGMSNDGRSALKVCQRCPVLCLWRLNGEARAGTVGLGRAGTVGLARCGFLRRGRCEALGSNLSLSRWLVLWMMTLYALTDAGPAPASCVTLVLLDTNHARIRHGQPQEQGRGWSRHGLLE